MGKTISEEIIRARYCGVVHCGVLSQATSNLGQLAQEFGLHIALEHLTPIERPDARRLAVKILHKDLAYSSETMTESEATRLADGFLRLFDDDATYHTNGNFHIHEVGSANGATAGLTWTPATDAAFDTGILVLGHQRSGCLWVEDED